MKNKCQKDTPVTKQTWTERRTNFDIEHSRLVQQVASEKVDDAGVLVDARDADARESDGVRAVRGARGEDAVLCLRAARRAYQRVPALVQVEVGEDPGVVEGAEAAEGKVVAVAGFEDDARGLRRVAEGVGAHGRLARRAEALLVR